MRALRNDLIWVCTKQLNFHIRIMELQIKWIIWLHHFYIGALRHTSALMCFSAWIHVNNSFFYCGNICLIAQCLRMRLRIINSCLSRRNSRKILYMRRIDLCRNQYENVTLRWKYYFQKKISEAGEYHFLQAVHYLDVVTSTGQGKQTSITYTYELT